MPQLDQRRSDELPQPLHVGIDAQGIGLLPEQILEQFEILGVAEQRREFAQARAYGQRTRGGQAGEELGLVGGVLHLASPGVVGACR